MAGGGTRWSSRSVLIQTILGFYDSLVSLESVGISHPRLVPSQLLVQPNLLAAGAV